MYGMRRHIIFRRMSMYKSTASRERYVTPVRQHWSYVSLALSHRNTVVENIMGDVSLSVRHEKFWKAMHDVLCDADNANFK